MSQETPTGGTEMADAAEQVNKLLHELETMVDAEQHTALTEFFAEWEVLSAMRTTLQMQPETGGETPSTETEKGA
jgi:hypothetical protein